MARAPRKAPPPTGPSIRDLVGPTLTLHRSDAYGLVIPGDEYANEPLERVHLADVVTLLALVPEHVRLMMALTAEDSPLSALQHAAAMQRPGDHTELILTLLVAGEYDTPIY